MEAQVAYGEAGIGNVTPANLWEQDEEFREILFNLIRIHVVSEDHGADVFERSILRAPTPEQKMRMAKTVMEEYGHHMRFRGLLDELDIDWREFCYGKDHLTTFDVPIETWCDQVVFLALVDRAAAHQFRQFVNSAYEPFRIACRDTLNEEYGHVGFGMDGVKALLDEPGGRSEVEEAVWKWLAVGLASFGSDGSRSSERYRYWGFKSDSNKAMKETYYSQVRGFITGEWGIEIPETVEGFRVAAEARIPAEVAETI
jgi:1,2-phenylacetyl-CoA epoxidase catalytic subunit